MSLSISLARRRAPSYALSKVRRERQAFLRENVLAFVGFFLAVAVTAGFAVVTRPDLLTGVWIGAGIASLCWVLHFVIAMRNYSAFIGARAERLTARMLKAAPKEWRCVANLPFERYDVDQVILTSDAVLAVEVKWRGLLEPKQETFRHRSDLDQATYSARQMRLFLYSCHLKDVEVIPVLLMWGPGTPEMTGGRAIEDGVHVLDGNEFDTWQHHYVTGARLRPSIESLYAALNDHIAKCERVHSPHASATVAGRPSPTGGNR